MPNHVTTRLRVEGPQEALNRFYDVLTPERELSFDRIIPMPEILKGSESSSSASFGLIALTKQEPSDRFGSVLSYPWVQEKGITTLEQFSQWVHAQQPQWIAAGLRAQQCLQETGYVSWYDWSVATWGTKWDAYDQLVLESEVGGHLVLCFDTAWSFPEPVMRKLVKDFPELRFSGTSLDEGWNFAVRFTSDSGELQVSYEEATDQHHLEVHGELPTRDEEEENA